ncbi:MULTISPECIES: hypothetical protein [Burkholderia]|uniref:hypothetical protein n=1 Tax=Burkholderia TaxID=32008 RepID=UPI00075E5C08|nr:MULTISPECIES: hypothetical protein [Burkholderia]AOJ69344.1 hypothetical protein WS78_11705 [Burkholderia savannae]KVG37463.1 hypothetical protein WS77_01935 [Burkholderia sp. MSMB0265]KVG88273.1 hypothetical protein WS81_25290 [Burkholderia sp. MSMB2040]KVG93824.1 hypothetical protein WS82_08785 [Burkholderia sp. MSMB2041]KVH01076.1 hypothetical protein WS83_20345 [Burkholderia sp. MSMB2042]
MSISFNPMVTSSPTGTFRIDTEGYVQGAVMDDPSSNMWLASAIIAASVTGPVWGGMAITENVAAPNQNGLGNSLVIAANNAGVTGFTVINRSYNAILTPGNNVPQLTAGMTAMFYRLGSNARIAVQCDATLAGNLDTGAINQQVSWDFTNQKLVAYSSGAGALACKVLSVNTKSKIVSYNSGTGALTWTEGAAAIIQI